MLAHSQPLFTYTKRKANNSDTSEEESTLAEQTDPQLLVLPTCETAKIFLGWRVSATHTQYRDGKRVVGCMIWFHCFTEERSYAAILYIEFIYSIGTKEQQVWSVAQT